MTNQPEKRGSPSGIHTVADAGNGPTRPTDGKTRTTRRRAAPDVQKLGLKEPSEWLLISPARYVDYASIIDDFQTLALGVPCVVRGTVVRLDYYKTGIKDPLPPHFWEEATRLSLTLANDGHDTIDVQVFGRPHYAWKNVAQGATVVVRALPKLSPKAAFELQSAELVPPQMVGTIQPVYPSLKGLKGATIAKEIRANIHELQTAAAIVEKATGWSDPSEPVSYATFTTFPTPVAFLRALHRPTNLDEALRAQRASRRICAFALVRATHSRRLARPIIPASKIAIDRALLEQLIAAVPFPLTKDQRRAILAIGAHLAASSPLQGLLTGDVGTGKTLAFLLPAVAAHLRGARVIVLTPNLALINSLSRELANLFPHIPVATCTGDGIAGDPARAIILGNTALLGALKKHRIPGHADFLVIDEQHKFSTEQRALLAGAHTNVLEATATPIPRTTALVAHAGADVFTLRDRPFKRDIRTAIFVSETALEARNEVLSAVLHRGEQAAVVYPLVGTDDDEHTRITVANAINSWERYLPRDRIAVLHGKMNGGEKEAVLASVQDGQCDLLITSTVIEVGLNLPNLRTMLVVHAERMGAITLHQLRGRLARHGGPGHMLLYAPAPSQESLSRLKLVAENDDGFTLAEKDAEIRGFGDLLGTDGDTQRGKTRTLFLGVEIGPQIIGLAADRYQQAVAQASRDTTKASSESAARTSGAPPQHLDGDETGQLHRAVRRMSPR